MIIISNSRALTHDEFFKRFRENRPGIELVSGKYENQKTRMKVRHSECGYEWEASASNLMQPGGCPMCNGSVRMTHDVFVKKLAKLTDTIKPITQYKTAKIPIKFHCDVCDQIFETAPHTILMNPGCPVCRGFRVVVGYNDFNHVCPDLVKYLANEEDGLKLTYGSHKKIRCKCPDCGYEKDISVWNLYNQGFSCSVCGDGVSYPNKFIREVLSQIKGLSFQCEYHEKWCDKYFYDCYFKLNNSEYVIEMDGAFHYEDRNFGRRSYEEIRAADEEKDRLAKDIGVVMIRVDCREATMDYIKNSIEDSELSKIFDLSNIDWQKCDANAQKNLVRTSCEYYEKNKNDFPILEIAEQLHIGRFTLYKYILKGVEYGWCNSSKEERMKLGKKFQKWPQAIGVRIFKNGKNLGEFMSLTKAQTFLRSIGVKMAGGTIGKAIRTNDGVWNDFVFELI